MKTTRSVLVTLGGLALLLGCHDPEGPVNAQTHTVTQPVVNGTREPQTVPLSESQIMALGWLYPSGSPLEVICTGVLIAPHVVVTSKVCVTGPGVDDPGFGVGLDPASPAALFSVSTIYSHEAVDAALMVLEEDATGGDVEITPIPVSSEGIDASAEGRAVQVGGFGDTLDAETDGRWFATVYITEVTDEDIVVDGRGEQGMCFGDSGGPLIDLDGDGNPVVLAVESWGDSSCVDVDHMVRLDTLIDTWIEPILAGGEPGDVDGGDADQDAGPVDLPDAGDDSAVDLPDAQGADTQTSTGGASASNSDTEDEGCGCASARGGGSPGVVPLVFLALLLGWRRRQTSSPRHPRDTAG